MAKSTKIKEEDRLIERTVQEIAQNYLENYYRRWGRSHIYSNLEERTKKKYGMKRADGLLAYRKSRRNAYVITMEAKSHKTLPALKPYRVNSLWIRDSIWKGMLITSLSGIMFFVWNMMEYPPFIQLGIPLSVWTAATITYAQIFKNSHRYQEMKVIKQVFQYPANEQWLSFSYDAFDLINPKLQNNLFKICKARGVGVLIVSPTKTVRLVHKAKRRRKWFGKDYLNYYNEEYNIRKFLAIKTTAK